MYAYLSQAMMNPNVGLEVQNISGTLTGSYPKKRYNITGDCIVLTGGRVSFAAGSILDFAGDFYIEVVGQIQLDGTSGQRITIQPSVGNVNQRWRGFRLAAQSGDSFTSGENNTVNKFTYCDFIKAEKLQETVGNYHRTRGAAVFAYLYESIEITNCTFTSCKGYDYGGTVYLHVETGGTTIFSGNSFTNCSAQNDSAGGWVFTHGIFNVGASTYSGNTSGWAVGNAFGYTVNTTSDLFTSTSGVHYSETGMIVRFATNANAPAPCVAGVAYYFIAQSTTTWKLASTLADAYAGTAINITAVPSGTAICKLQEDYAWFDATVTIT